MHTDNKVTVMHLSKHRSTISQLAISVARYAAAPHVVITIHNGDCRRDCRRVHRGDFLTWR